VRVLIQPGSWVAGQRVGLDEHELHHLRVRRAKRGEAIEVLDGAGLVGTGELIRVGSNWMVNIRTAERQTKPAELTLAVAAGDRERFFWMAEKAVELGVTRIIPLETERTAGVGSRFRSAHLEKLRRTVLEATKQCGTAWVPSVEAPLKFGEFVRGSRPGRGWLADVTGAPPPATLDRAPLAAVVGPEGGFTGQEREALVAAGYKPTALGSHVLRFETAALSAAAAATTARMRGNHG
jgi:16S rRNA (uracil1498-N3)-methyltransferase